MRQNQGTKRSRGRNSNRRSGPSRNQTFDSNGPSVRIRGNASQVHEKYLAMARDASSAGDRIAAENYLQHAEHYYRILAVQREDAEARGQGNQQGRGNGRDDRDENTHQITGSGTEGFDQPTGDIDEMPAFVTKKVRKPAKPAPSSDDSNSDTESEEVSETAVGD
ncbi:MAG: DUF4167 domain-containing protein [Rickettsiales bacterium]